MGRIHFNHGWSLRSCKRISFYPFQNSNSGSSSQQSNQQNETCKYSVNTQHFLQVKLATCFSPLSRPSSSHTTTHEWKVLTTAKYSLLYHISRQRAVESSSTQLVQYNNNWLLLIYMWYSSLHIQFLKSLLTYTHYFIFFIFMLCYFHPISFIILWIMCPLLSNYSKFHLYILINPYNLQTPTRTRLRICLPSSPYVYIGHQCTILDAYYWWKLFKEFSLVFSNQNMKIIVISPYISETHTAAHLPTYGLDFNLMFNYSWKLLYCPVLPCNKTWPS
jgi:hypothetical protein